MIKKKNRFSHLKNLMQLLGLSYHVYHANFTHGAYHKYVKRIALQTIRQSRELKDEHFPERNYKKIQWYMVNTLFMGRLLGRLIDCRLSRKEEEKFIYWGAVIALTDAVIDDFNYSRKDIENLFKGFVSNEKTDSPKKQSAIEQIFLLYWNKLREVVEKEKWEKFVTACERLLSWQLDSLNQKKAIMSEEEVQNITIQKGGTSIVLLLHLFPEARPELNNPMNELGGFIQMMNDCQDLHKDLQEGVTTFLHFKQNFTDIIEALDSQRIVAFRELKSLNIPDRKLSDFIFCFYAMFTGVLYKLQLYASYCQDSLDFNQLSQMPKEVFRINSFSFKAIRFCLGIILRFDYETCEKRLSTLENRPVPGLYPATS
jgi:hypothetical protein